MNAADELDDVAPSHQLCLTTSDTEVQESTRDDSGFTDRYYELASTRTSQLSKEKQWNLNYMEAAIYLQEGQNNDKFFSHPKFVADVVSKFQLHCVLGLLVQAILVGEG